MPLPDENVVRNAGRADDLELIVGESRLFPGAGTW